MVSSRREKGPQKGQRGPNGLKLMASDRGKRPGGNDRLARTTITGLAELRLNPAEGPVSAFTRQLLELTHSIADEFMTDQSRQEQIEALRKRREELQSKLEEIQSGLKEGLPNEPEEQAPALSNLDTLEEISRTTRVELERVEQELARLQDSGSSA